MTVYTTADYAAASADRRPVDPPPIVELKIFEGEPGQERDVTFTVTANYFLFSTLEQARNIAPGRGQQPQNQLTVLTGTPVAGMVYLDRPNPAGYFIFPDLSVRHEGKYRLSFSLYEELKEAKDEDKDSDPSKSSDAGDAHVTHRLEVKSVPFTVYSAKKFPGLTESTALSRMVAEQGCRVRIRRDVRMRRRDAKGKDWDGYEDETADARSRMSATPEATAYPPMAHGYADPISRPRSTSNASHHSLAQPAMSRRTSTQEMQQGYYPSAHSTAPHTPQTSYAQTSTYGPSSGPQQYSQSSYMPQQPQAMQPPPQFPQPTYQAAPPAPSAASAPSSQSYYGYTSAPAPPMQAPQAQYGPPPPTFAPAAQPTRMSVDYSAAPPIDHRRASSQLHIPPPPAPSMSTSGHCAAPLQPQPYQPAPPASGYQRAPEPSISSMSNYSSRPAPAEPPVRPSGIATPLSARPSFDAKLPSINTQLPSLSSKYLEPASPASAIAPPGYSASVQTPVDSHKRGFGQVFNDSHLTNPLRQGARPSDAGYGPSSGSTGFVQSTDVDDDDAEPEFNMRQQMIYRRANGRQIARHLPVHS